MNRIRINFSRRVGMAPGSLTEEKESHEVPAEMSLFRYDEISVEQSRITDKKDLEGLADNQKTLWLDVLGVHDSGVLRTAAQVFCIHPIVTEDIQHTIQRPKAEEYGEQMFMIMQMLTWNNETSSVETEQVSIVSGPGYVLSFQEHPGDVFDPVRRRLLEGLGRIRNMKADYLAYALADAVVDNYFLVLEKLQEEFEDLEEQVLFHNGSDPSNRVHALTRELLTLRRAVWPLREAISSITRGQIPAVSEEVQVFMRDVYDHIVQIMDWVELMRDSLKGLVDSYQTKMGNSTNAVMRMLTIVATIFIPLTFIAGVYGMNFAYMPELSWPWGYPMAIGLMLFVASGMLFYFKRKKWL